MKRIFFISAVLGILIACDKDEIEDLDKADYLLFGDYYGFCMGDGCVDIYKLSQDKLYEDSNDNYPSQNSNYDGNYTELTNAQYNEVSSLLNNFPSELWLSESQTFGSPDSYDQGGIYIELKNNGETKKWNIDTDVSEQPAYLTAFIEEIIAAITYLQ